MGTVSLNNGENIIQRSQGALHFKISWYLGHLYLTDRRLLFIQATQKKLDVRLDRIIGINIAKKPWHMGNRVRQLCIDFDRSKGPEQACIALAKPEKWVIAIKDSMALMLAERCGCNGTNPKPSNNT